MHKNINQWSELVYTVAVLWIRIMLIRIRIRKTTAQLNVKKSDVYLSGEPSRRRVFYRVGPVSGRERVGSDADPQLQTPHCPPAGS